MRKPENLAGAIYDVDDTLLDNRLPSGDSKDNLHQIARLEAIHKFAMRKGGKYAKLIKVTPEQNHSSFERAPVSTVPGALYVILKDYGIALNGFDPNDPAIDEILRIKNIKYKKLLEAHGKPIEGAVNFIHDLTDTYGLDNLNAIASSGNINDIEIFLRMVGLSDYFPDERIIDLSKVEESKPNPESFNTAFRSLKLPESARKNTVAFEDDPRGMLAARKAGLYVCALTTNYTREVIGNCEAKPDVIADSYDELADYFGIR